MEWAHHHRASPPLIVYFTLSTLHVQQVLDCVHKYTTIPSSEVAFFSGTGTSDDGTGFNTLKACREEYSFIVTTYFTLATTATDRGGALRALAARAPFLIVVADECNRVVAPTVCAAMVALFEQRKWKAMATLGVTMCSKREGPHGAEEEDKMFRLFGGLLYRRDLALRPTRCFTVVIPKGDSDAPQQDGEFQQRLLQWVDRHAEPPVLVFVHRRKFAHALATAANTMFPGVGARAITGVTPLDEQNSILEAIQEGQCQVLIGTRVIAAGTNIVGRHVLKTVVIARFEEGSYLSTDLAGQMAGRGQRKRQGTTRGAEPPAVVVTVLTGDANQNKKKKETDPPKPNHEHVVAAMHRRLYAAQGHEIAPWGDAPPVRPGGLRGRREGAGAAAPPAALGAPPTSRIVTAGGWRVNTEATSHPGVFRATVAPGSDARKHVGPGDIVCERGLAFRVLDDPRWSLAQRARAFGACGGHAQRREQLFACLYLATYTDRAAWPTWARAACLAFTQAPTLRGRADAVVACARANWHRPTGDARFCEFVRFLQVIQAAPKHRMLAAKVMPAVSREFFFVVRAGPAPTDVPRGACLLDRPCVETRAAVLKHVLTDGRGIKTRLALQALLRFPVKPVVLLPTKLARLLDLLPGRARETELLRAAMARPGPSPWLLQLGRKKGEKQCVTAMRYAGLATCTTSKPSPDGPRVETWRTVERTVIGLLILRGVSSLCVAQPSATHDALYRVTRGWFQTAEK
jgi:hypothetical protein